MGASMGGVSIFMGVSMGGVTCEGNMGGYGMGWGVSRCLAALNLGHVCFITLQPSNTVAQGSLHCIP